VVKFAGLKAEYVEALNYNASYAIESKVVMAGLVSAIHVLASDERRGCAGQARA
jgi:hypothetical protein